MCTYEKKIDAYQKKVCFFLIVLISLLLLVVSCTAVQHIKQGKNEEIMLSIPAGEFIMGSNEPVESGLGLSAAPERKVYVGSFLISKYETTNSQYLQFVQAGGYKKKKYWSKEGWDVISKNAITIPRNWRGTKKRGYFFEGHESYPVTGVNWYEAEAFANFRQKRLLSETEWEKAARGTDAREYPWGNEFDKFKCNVLEAGIGAVLPVGGFLGGASPYGVMDMCGNIEEWTTTVFTGNAGSLRNGVVVLKGGAWQDQAKSSTTWWRVLGEKGFLGNYHFGIRLGGDVPNKKEEIA